MIRTLAWLAALTVTVSLGAVADADAAAPCKECSIPAMLVVDAGVAGKPLRLTREALCLPAGDTFSHPQIEWGDGTTSMGA
jgi:hypothetical protein